MLVVRSINRLPAEYIEFWNEQIGANDNLQMYLFQYPAFRNLFYYRLRNHRALVEILKIFCRPMYGFELNAKLGAGSVVVKDVESNSIVVGNPAHKIG